MGDELNLENIESKATFEPQTNELNFDAPKSSSDGTKDYKKLENKPSINGVELVGNKTSEELNLQNKLTAGENIEITNNKINVLTSDKVEKDNTKPITSSAVYTEVGNINVLLKTI